MPTTLQKIKLQYGPARVSRFSNSRRPTLTGFPSPLKYCLDKAEKNSIGEAGLRADCLVVQDDDRKGTVITAIVEVGTNKRISEAKRQLRASLLRLNKVIEPETKTLSICLLLIGTSIRSKGSEGILARTPIVVAGKRFRLRVVSCKKRPIWQEIEPHGNRVSFP